MLLRHIEGHQFSMTCVGTILHLNQKAYKKSSQKWKKTYKNEHQYKILKDM